MMLQNADEFNIQHSSPIISIRNNVTLQAMNSRDRYTDKASAKDLK